MEAAGFASAIITFVEFSYKLVNGSITAYESGTGLIDQDVTRVVDDLETATKAIDVIPIQASSGPHWAELRELATSCNALSNDLIVILQKTRLRQDGNRALRSFGAAWASLRSSKDVMEIQRKLNEYRAQILLRLSLILDGRQQWIAKQLEELHTGNARYFKETVAEFESLQTTIKELESRLSKQALEDQRVYNPKEDHSDSLAEIRAELSRVSSAISSSTLKNATADILDRLRFDTIYSRVDHISEGEFQLFSWLFGDGQQVGKSIDKESASVRRHGVDGITDEARDGARASITQWLEIGDKVLHISGKAGSGKSTLMKRLSLDPALKKKLERWSGDKTLVLASFFFWGTGDKQQNSLEGLYRSLLYELLMKYPNLTSVAFPGAIQNSHASTDVSFRLTELRQALANLIEAENALPDHRFCFFIDGLDEYQGDAADHINLAQQLRRWATFSNVKICASSRPHPEFHSIFDKAARMNLHELTGSDIHQYAYKAFQNCPGVQMDLDQLDEIARVVVGQADGVLLWVRLAIPALLGHLQYASDKSGVLSELYRLPSNLDSLFTKLFDSITATERTRAYRLLLIVKVRRESYAVALSWIDDLKDADFPYNRPWRGCPDDEISRRVAQVEHQLKVLCKGLVELRPTYSRSNYFEYDVGFMHRSVQDFLDHPDTISSMKRHLGASFDAMLDAQRLNLAAFKFARWDLVYFDTNSVSWEHADLRYLLYATLLNGPPRVLDELESILDCYRAEIANKTKASPEQPDYCHSLWRDTSKRGPISWGYKMNLRQIHVRPHHNDMDVSFAHCLAFNGHMEALVQRVKQHGSGYFEKNGLCLILSAFMCRESQSTRVIQSLLDAGVHISNEISLWTIQDGEDPHHQYVPFWVVVIAILAYQNGTSRAVSGARPSGFYPGLEVLLRAGVAPRPDMRVEFEHQGEPVFLSFEELIIYGQPANSDILIRELRRSTWRGWAGQWMSRAAGLWSNGTTSTTPSAGALSGHKSQHAAGFTADGFSLRRIWIGADKFDVSSNARIRIS